MKRYRLWYAAGLVSIFGILGTDGPTHGITVGIISFFWAYVVLHIYVKRNLYSQPKGEYTNKDKQTFNED